MDKTKMILYLTEAISRLGFQNNKTYKADNINQL